MSSLRTKILGGFAGLIATSLVVAGATVPAAATENPTIASARAFLAQYGANHATQERLIDIYLAGGVWDSMRGSVPLSTERYSAADADYSVNKYHDGSISVTRAELPEKTADGAQSRGISGCTVSGSARNNCKIDMWVGLVAMSFHASYNLGNNTVTNTYGAGWSIGGACGVDLVYLGRPASNVGRMDLKAQMCAIPYSTTFWLQLTVKGGSASVSWTA